MMSEVRINRASYNFCIDFSEFFNAIIEGKNFSRAYKCAVTIENNYKSTHYGFLGFEELDTVCS
jgi:hypothetical protein